MAAGSTGRCNTGVKSLCWGCKSQGLAWAFVELARHFVEMGLRVHRQVGFLRKILSQQTIGVLVGSALPWTLRVHAAATGTIWGRRACPPTLLMASSIRVHGIKNLYIAVSSVLPRCGGRNPTLTIVLLALRLGDFCTDKVKARRSSRHSLNVKNINHDSFLNLCPMFTSSIMMRFGTICGCNFNLR